MWFPKRTRTSRKAAAAAAAPSYSAEIIASNIDLLYEILLRLPAKSLIKFKSVSKHWLSLISDTKFCRRHSSRRRLISDPASGLFLNFSSRPEFEFVNLDKAHSSTDPSRGPFRSLAFDDDVSGIRIIQSCNGLLLCRPVLDYKSRINYVYNPTTKHYAKLPPSPTPRNIGESTRTNYTVLGVSLAFDPSKSPHYKVVCVSDSCGVFRPTFNVEIYSSETGCWTLSSSSIDKDMLPVRFDGGVFWNGSIHWLNNRDEYLLCFNVDEERLSSPIPLPPVPEGWVQGIGHRYFGESSGHLHFVCPIHKAGARSASYLDVFEMGVDYSGWFLKFRVDLLALSVAIPIIIQGKFVQRSNFDKYVFSVLCVVRGELDDGESYIVLKIRSRVIRYNFNTRTSSMLCYVESDRAPTPHLLNWPLLLHPEQFSDCFDGHVYQYIPSLCSV
ncbi:F-box domain containing protein [Trema orientale]|uniref:F-box domain containing protein n=1 Tax=Trema orientale TaxID=63057 RepID=A0A2P5F3P1_TREOI|nr:F-box domain containing protein [Trema orientale]